MIYVFDLDGTLIDSELRHGVLIKRILGNAGIPTDGDFLNKYLEKKRMGKNSKMILLEEFIIDEEAADTLVGEWIEGIENDEMLLYDKLYFDSLDTLKRIKESSQNIYFLSLRNRKDAAVSELKRLGIYDYATDLYIGATELGELYKAKKLTELKTIDEVIMIGDTEIDYEASKMAGVSSYIVSRGFRNEEFLNTNSIKSFMD